ncbi:MAG: hypothetical protein QOG19_2534 [Mycobacterium sp.]|nr:hypothetical protein [Mycobacterium sp.]
MGVGVGLFDGGQKGGGSRHGNPGGDVVVVVVVGGGGVVVVGVGVCGVLTGGCCSTLVRGTQV